MKNATKLLGAVAIASVIAAGSSAFTAGGLTLAGGQETRSVGGTVSQTVTGGITLNSIAYGYADVNNLEVDEITLTFAADTTGRAVTVLLDSADRGFTCDVEAIPADGTVVLCETATPYAGLNSLAVSIAA